MIIQFYFKEYFTVLPIFKNISVVDDFGKIFDKWSNISISVACCLNNSLFINYNLKEMQNSSSVDKNLKDFEALL